MRSWRVARGAVWGSAGSGGRRSSWRLLVVVAASVMIVAALSACGSSDPSDEAKDPNALASELLDRYAVAVFERDQQALGDLLSDAYLLRRSDGSGYDRQGYLDALAQGSDYELVDYSITDISARQDGDILVATFTLNADIQERAGP